MDKLILVVNEYPLTSFFVFLGFYILIQSAIKLAEVVFLNIKTK